MTILRGILLFFPPAITTLTAILCSPASKNLCFRKSWQTIKMVLKEMSWVTWIISTDTDTADMT